MFYLFAKWGRRKTREREIARFCVTNRASIGNEHGEDNGHTDARSTFKP